MPNINDLAFSFLGGACQGLSINDLLYRFLSGANLVLGPETYAVASNAGDPIIVVAPEPGQTVVPLGAWYIDYSGGLPFDGNDAGLTLQWSDGTSAAGQDPTTDIPFSTGDPIVLWEAAQVPYGSELDITAMEGLPLQLVFTSDIGFSGTGTLRIYIPYVILCTDLPAATMYPLFNRTDIGDDTVHAFFVAGDATALTGQFSVRGTFAYDGVYTLAQSILVTGEPLEILSVSLDDPVAGLSTIQVAGDQRLVFAGNGQAGATIAGSTGNDGTYLVNNVNLAGDNTDIVLLGTLPDATADGTITTDGTPYTSLVTVDELPFSTAQSGWVYQA